MRLLLIFAFVAVLRGQMVEDWLLFQPVTRDIGRYLQTGREQTLRGWSPLPDAVAQLDARRQTQQPWSERSAPIVRLVRVERITASEVELSGKECTVSSVMLAECTPIAIRLEKAEGRWRLVSYGAFGLTIR